MKLTRLLLPLLLGSASFAGTLCSTGVTSVPTFALTATTGFVGDVTVDCTNTGFGGTGIVGTVNFFFFTSVPLLNIGPWILTQGSNTYTGVFFASNQVRFTGVSYDQNLPAVNFEVSGIEVNPSLSPPSFQYHEDISINGNVSLPLDVPDLRVAVNADSPEPATLPLAMSAACALLAVYRRRRAPSLH
jgi:hypothetical protein